MAPQKGLNPGKLIIIFLILGLVGLFFSTGMHHYLTLDFIKASRIRFQEIYGQNPVRVIALFVGFYIPVIALNLPGAMVLGVAAGALFGTFTGTVIISFASTIGATLACLLSRYLLREWVQKRFGSWLERINNGIRTEGPFYLFSLRLIPVVPFFLINMAMGLTPIPLWTFYWVSQLGMLPGSAIFVNAGSQIAQIDSLGGIISGRLLISLALLGIFPLVAKKLLNLYRIRRKCDAPTIQNTMDVELSVPLKSALESIGKGCTNCGACKINCSFLQEYGTPKEIVDKFDFSRPDHQAMAFDCNLCNLCGALCPEKLEPGDLFHTIRRQAMDTGSVDLSRYRAILNYEKRGGSPLFSYYGLPRGCDTIFFPGCTLPGTRPETTWQIFHYLQQRYPALGIVLDCCTKPSHDLGRQNHFEQRYCEIRTRLLDNQIRKVVVACPNCYKIFKDYGKGLEVKTVYEVIGSGDLPPGAAGKGELVVHDPCPLRQETEIQDSVRSILIRMGLTLSEMNHGGKLTLCCGEGGSVGFVQPLLALEWGKMRRKEANGRKIVTYCAGCAGFLNRITPTVHIADVLFSPDRAINGDPRVAKSPFTYINRLKLKHRFKGALEPALHPSGKCTPHDIPTRKETKQPKP